MKQPLVTVALLYGAGLMLGKIVEAPLLATFAVAFALALLALRIPTIRPWLVSASVLLLGWLNMTSRTAIVSPIDLRTHLQERAALVSVRGHIASAPSQRLFLRNGAERAQTLALIDVHSVRLPHADWQPALGRMMSRTAGTLPEQFVQDQTVEITGVALQPEPPLVPGTFDYAQHLNSRGIHYELKIESPGDWKLAGPLSLAPLSQRFRDWAQRTLARGLPPDESLRLQWAMLLGWQTALTPEVSEPFMRSGTMHVFAISGLHIALIAGIFLALFRALLVPRLLCGAAVITIIWFYTGATGWQASAIRSTVMMTVIIGGWMLKRPANLLNSLSAAACIILVWQPEQLFQASFQLSFFVVLSLALLSPLIEKWKPSLIKPDPLLPWELRPWWQRQALKTGDWLWKALATSIAAFLGSVPLIAYYFHLFTPGSVLANVVVVPVSGLALMSGLGALITGDLVPLCTDWFNHSGWIFMHLMIWLSEQAANAPGAWHYVRSPSPVLFFLYYGLLIAACAGWFAKRALRRIAIPMAVVLASVAAIQRHRDRTWHRLTVLPLHSAHAVCVQPARGGSEWFINCGNASTVDFIVKPFWQANGGNSIENLLLTHGNSRFVSGALSLHGVFPIHKTFASPVNSRSSRYRELMSDLEVKSRLHRAATNGFNSGPWQIIHPASSDRFSNAADNSVVALGTFDGVRVLLVAELGRAGQNAVFTRHPDLRADIVVTGRAEEIEPLATEWLNVIRPQLIIVADSVPLSNQAAHTTRTRFRQTGARIIQTHSAGAVTLTIRNGIWRVATARPLTGPEPEPETGDPNAPDE